MDGIVVEDQPNFHCLTLSRHNLLLFPPSSNRDSVHLFNLYLRIGYLCHHLHISRWFCYAVDPILVDILLHIKLMFLRICVPSWVLIHHFYYSALFLSFLTFLEFFGCIPANLF